MNGRAATFHAPMPMPMDLDEPVDDKVWRSLSESEVRVVRLLCEGLTNPEIAERLFVSRRTVQSHLYNVFKKVGVRSRTELVARAVAAGLLPPDAGHESR